jgi:mannose-6-phosphate isomerase-like protein (cupin superfamily)
MGERPDYRFHMDERFGPLEKFDVGALADACADPWWNQTLCRVNDCVARLGVIQGEFHWHRHDAEDELFLVLSGRLLVDLEGRTEELGPRQAILVPRGVLHRTRAPERTVMLMVEGANVDPAGQ